MKFTPEQRLIISLLCDIHQKLDIRDSFDPEMITNAIQSGNEWAIDVRYGDYLGSEVTDPRFDFIGDVLSMCETVETSYANLSLEDQETVKSGTIFNASRAFDGFDGNNESAFMSATRFMVNELELFTYFEGREFNSHAPSIDTYKRMLDKFNRICNPYLHQGLSTDQIIDIMNEKIHPSNR